MNKINRYLVITVVAACVVGFAGPIVALAASTPSLGTAATFGVLSSTYSNASTSTVIGGDVGYVTGPATAPTVSGATHVNDGTFSSAGSDAATALTNLNGQGCDFTFVAPDVVLDTTLEHSATYGPGVYCSTGTMAVGTAGGITLSGAGTYIFRSGGALNAVAGSKVNLASGASACDVFWTPNGATTFNTNSTFVGTVIPVSQAITVLDSTSWTGRALTFGSTITTPDSNVHITVPTCVVPPAPASINVVKVVVNGFGGSKVVSDFPLFVNSTLVTSGATNVFSAPASYTVTESNSSGYSQAFSADCPGGVISLNPGDAKVCTITNTQLPVLQEGTRGGSGSPAVTPVVAPVPPIISVVKVPNPLALPAGPGPVTYTYTLKNIGTVPVTNITMVDDSCSLVKYISGDTNGDSKLDLNETWIYTCSITLSATHTNTVVATGYANGVSATDVATATVVVGVPAVVPPLIHVTKVPNPLTLPSIGGMVTYTEQITNPGTVPLSNVQLTDDKCSPLNFISGDNNGNSQLDPNETWTYTCQTDILQTTTNTATATGYANGITAKDFALATVVVAPVVPKLPNTGFPPANKNITWIIVMAAGILLLVSTSVVMVIKKRKI